MLDCICPKLSAIEVHIDQWFEYRHRSVYTRLLTIQSINWRSLRFQQSIWYFLRYSIENCRWVGVILWTMLKNSIVYLWVSQPVSLYILRLETSFFCVNACSFSLNLNKNVSYRYPKSFIHIVRVGVYASEIYWKDYRWSIYSNFLSKFPRFITDVIYILVSVLLSEAFLTPTRYTSYWSGSGNDIKWH